MADYFRAPEAVEGWWQRSGCVGYILPELLPRFHRLRRRKEAAIDLFPVLAQFTPDDELVLIDMSRWSD